jgi:hypothetical protein
VKEFLDLKVMMPALPTGCRLFLLTTNQENTMNSVNQLSLVALAVGLASMASLTQASPTDSIAEMVKTGKAKVDLRYRYEAVDEDNAKKDAKASTLRSRLTLETGTVSGFTALLEADNMRTLGPDQRVGGELPE